MRYLLNQLSLRRGRIERLYYYHLCEPQGPLKDDEPRFDSGLLADREDPPDEVTCGAERPAYDDYRDTALRGSRG